jgi:hypothetical protein
MIEDNYKEAERERIIGLLTLHRSEIRVCRYSYDGYHPMLTTEELRAFLAPKVAS